MRSTRPRALSLRSPFVRFVLAVTLGALLLVRGRTIAIACYPALAATPSAEAAPVMPMVDWFATHPARGQSALAAPTDSFLVQSSYFDSNHDGSVTQVDTVKIVQGQTVLWKWVIGLHTVTSGTGASDPQAGVLFDQPSNTSNRSFSFTFNNVGTFPFFCRNHELLNMRGVVVVGPNLNDVPPSALAGGEGFVRAPWPNPSREASHFRFALARAGRARVTVLDAQGRRVATVVDSEFGPGSVDASWDGRTAGGRAVPAGLYLLRLELHGVAQTQRVTIVR